MISLFYYVPIYNMNHAWYVMLLYWTIRDPTKPLTMNLGWLSRVYVTFSVAGYEDLYDMKAIRSLLVNFSVEPTSNDKDMYYNQYDYEMEWIGLSPKMHEPYITHVRALWIRLRDPNHSLIRLVQMGVNDHIGRWVFVLNNIDVMKFTRRCQLPTNLSREFEYRVYNSMMRTIG